MEPSSPPPALDGLVVEAVEWLPSGADAGLVRVRGRWADAGPREAALPALGLRRGGEERQFESLPDARFGRDPAVWRGTYLVPAALMADPPPELWLSWESGARSGLAAPERGFEPPGAPEPALAAAPEPDIGGEVIDRAVLAERRARRAEAAEREQARRAADALKALEVLELRSSELERRLEALQAAPPPAPPEPPAPVEVPVLDPAREEALAAAVADVRRLRGELDEQRSRRRKAELLRAADAVALAAAEREQARAAGLEAALEERTVALADAVARAEQAAEQVRLARARAAADAAEVRARAASAEAALGDARAELDRLRAAHAEASAAAEERAHDLAAIGAELARVRGELEAVRADAAGRVTELERRLAALDDELVRERRSRIAAAAELERARAGAGVAEAARRAETVARAALDAELDRERSERAATARALDAARSELEAVRLGRAELVIAREEALAQLATARGAADTAAESLDAALAERDAARAERDAARAERDAARADVAELRAALEAVQADAAAVRSSLEAAQADAAAVRSAYDATAADATAVRAAFAAVQEDSTAVRAALEAAHGELSALTAAHDAALRASEDLEAERDEAAREAVALHEELATLRDELAAASAGRDETGGLMARIAELEAAAGEDLGARAAQQTAASEAARADVPAGDLAARFDAAAAALRESAPAGSDEVSGAAEAAGAIDTAETAETAEAASGASGASAASAASAAGPAALVEPAPEPARTAPRIIDQAGHGARADVTGSSRREYPWLRGTVVKLAHDDPEAAARLLLGLVPAQSAVLSEPLEYDLTIREIGTHAISVAEGRASAAAIERPRMRSEAAFHVATDALSLAESLAGVPRRIGRWRGPVRVNGRRRGAETLRDLLTGADLSLAAAARAGAALDPDLVFRLFAYAIQPAWTKGHAFSVAQEVAGGRWLVTVADGAPVAVAAPREGQGADATVVMTRAAFDRLLRDEPAAAGELPVIRGDRAAVATLKAWTDRAQGR